MRKIGALLGVLVMGLALVSAATAGNWTLPQADAFASEIAGKPVQTYCESDWASWDQFAYSNNIVGHHLLGMTWLDQPIVYVNPSVCEALHMAVDLGPAGYRDAGMAYYAQAILTLTHEAVHQRGVEDEGQTECAALPLALPAAVKHLGLPATVKQTKLVRQRVKVKGKWTTKLVQKTVTVPNPDLTRVDQWIKAYHASAPAEYKTVC